MSPPDFPVSSAIPRPSEAAPASPQTPQGPTDGGGADSVVATAPFAAGAEGDPRAAGGVAGGETTPPAGGPAPAESASASTGESLTPEQYAQQKGYTAQYERGPDGQFQLTPEWKQKMEVEMGASAEAPKGAETKEQKAQRIDAQLTTLAEKMANGEMTPELLQQNMAELQGIRDEIFPATQSGLTPEQMKAALIKGMEIQGFESSRTKRAQELLQKMGQIEVAILTLPKHVGELRKARKEVKARLKETDAKVKAKRESLETSGNPNAMQDPEFAQMRQRRNGEYAQILKINDTIRNIKHGMVEKLSAEYDLAEVEIQKLAGARGKLSTLVGYGKAYLKMGAARAQFEMSDRFNLNGGDDDDEGMPSVADALAIAA